MAEENKRERNGIFSLKNILMFLIIISIAQPMIHNFKNAIQELIQPNTYIGAIKIESMILDPSYAVKHIHKFLKRDDIKGLLIKINSPGGLPGASQAIFNELKKFKLKKPVVAMVGDMAASGGYYIAAAADKIVSNPSALVGSIGVIAQLPMVKDLAEKWNIKMYVLQAGRYKATTNPFTVKTEEELAHFNTVIGDSYNQFTGDVAAARKLDIKNHETWANGKIFTANQGIKLKLIDKIGSLSEAKETLKSELEERGIPVEGEIKFVYPPKTSELSKALFGEDSETESTNMSYATTIGNFISAVIDQVSINNTSKGIKFQ